MKWHLLTIVLCILAIHSNAQHQEPAAAHPSPQSHMQLPPVILMDADGDGIADALDHCPNTPPNVPVDRHGCPLDRDGDGVPDYRDKELMTPSACQPVDSNGVGHCPCNCPSDAARKH